MVEPKLKKGDMITILFCEKCGEENTGNNGNKCVCGNWLYYHLMIKRQATLNHGKEYVQSTIEKMDEKERKIVKQLLQDVFQNDKTIYIYSRSEAGQNRNGALPKEGRWATPSELVQDAAEVLFSNRNIVFKKD